MWDVPGYVSHRSLGLRIRRVNLQYRGSPLTRWFPVFWNSIPPIKYWNLRNAFSVFPFTSSVLGLSSLTGPSSPSPSNDNVSPHSYRKGSKLPFPYLISGGLFPYYGLWVVTPSPSGGGSFGRSSRFHDHFVRPLDLTRLFLPSLPMQNRTSGWRLGPER